MAIAMTIPNSIITATQLGISKEPISSNIISLNMLFLSIKCLSWNYEYTCKPVEP